MSLSIYEQILNNMLRLVNKTKEDLLTSKDFYHKNKITEEVYKTWYNESLNNLYKEYPNENKDFIKKSFDLFDIKWGLLYIYQKAPEKISFEPIEGVKRKKLGIDNTLKDLTR